MLIIPLNHDTDSKKKKKKEDCNSLSKMDWLHSPEDICMAMRGSVTRVLPPCLVRTESPVYHIVNQSAKGYVVYI